MVCGSALFLFVVLSCKLGIGWTQEVCNYRYQRQPSAASLSSCNPTGSTVTIECAVTGPNTDFRIRWHRTSDMQDAGEISGTVIRFSEQSRLDTAVTPDTERNFIMSQLIIPDLQEEDFGYYWCSVRNTGEIPRTEPRNLPNPSRVILVSDPCNSRALQCSSSLNLWESTLGSPGRCANTIRNTTIDSPECDIPPTPSSMQLLLPLPTTTSTQPLQPTTTVPIVSSSELQVTSRVVPHIVTSTPLSGSQIDSIVPSTSVKPSNSDSSPMMQAPSTAGNEQPSSSPPLSRSIRSSKPSPFATDGVLLSSEIVSLRPSPTKIGSAAESKSQLGDHLIWVFSGVAVVTCLAAISLVLTLIVCIQCKKRRIKGITSKSQTYTVQENVSEPNSPNSPQDFSKQKLEHNGTSSASGESLERNHDYDIPNFLERPDKNGGTLQLSTRDEKDLVLSIPATYEDLPPDPFQSMQRHQYDTVLVNGSSNYHRLHVQHHSHEAKSQTGSGKLTVSRQHSAPTVAGYATVTSPDPIGTPKRHIDIYQYTDDEDYSRLKRSSSSTLPSSDLELHEKNSIYSDADYSRLDSQQCRSSLATKASPPVRRNLPPKSKAGSHYETLEVYPGTAQDGDDYSEVTDTPYDIPPDAMRTHPQLTQSGNNNSNDCYSRLETLWIDNNPAPIEQSPPTLDDPEDYSHLEAFSTKTEAQPSLSDDLFEVLYDRHDPGNAHNQSVHAEAKGVRFEAPKISHAYAPVLPSQPQPQPQQPVLHHVYSLPIVSTPEMYISEMGHMYHVLESSADNKN